MPIQEGVSQRRLPKSRRRCGCMPGKSVLSFLPIERIAQKLPKPLISSNRYQQPIAGNRKAVGNEIKPAAPHRRQHAEIDKGAIASEQIKQAQKEQQLWKYRVEALCKGHQPEPVHHPENRIEERR